MNSDSITIKGARQNNLKNIDVIITRNKLVVIIGISGSEKVLNISSNLSIYHIIELLCTSDSYIIST